MSLDAFSPVESSEPGSGRAQIAILAATEQLLRERPLNELSVADIIAAADISRTTFYSHFTSKTAVVAEALRRVMDQVMVVTDPFLADPAMSLEGAIRTSLQGWVEICSVHGALLRAVSEEWPHDEQLRTRWLEMLERASARTARVIRAARRDGHAPAGADADALSACLIWGYERVLHLALVGGARGLRDPEAVVEPLAQMMLGGLYGRSPSPPTQPVS
ncbi:MAG: TetR/AcrR family transcriptional regulator [Solirubrobacteraceae bacterium]